MAFGTAVHGLNGLIYISGAELEGANAWSINIPSASGEYLKFGDGWMNREKGHKSFNGNISAWHDQDAKKLQDAATATVAVSLLIYPKRSDLTTYYNGSAIFGASSEGNTTSVVSQAGDFVGDGELTLTGFS